MEGGESYSSDEAQPPSCDESEPPSCVKLSTDDGVVNLLRFSNRNFTGVFPVKVSLISSSYGIIAPFLLASSYFAILADSFEGKALEYLAAQSSCIKGGD